MLAGRRVEERLGAAERQRRELQLGLRLLEGRLLGRDVGQERSLLQSIQNLARLDLRAFDKFLLFEEGGDAGDEVDPVHGLNAADEGLGLGDRQRFGPRHADGRRPGRRPLGGGRRGEGHTPCDKRNEKTPESMRHAVSAR